MRTILIAVTLVACTASAFAQGTGKGKGKAINLTPVVCDRACLEGYVDKYLDAMVSHDPSKVPFAKDFKFTENGQRLIPGDGLWNTMTAKGTYRLFVTDVETQSVGFFGSIKEMNAGAMIGMRLKIRGGQITEAEQFIQRSPNSAAGFERIGYKWDTLIPVGERMTREQLIELANKYFTGMASNDGKGDYPFAADCNRIENGGMSTNTPTPPGGTRPDPKTATGYSSQWGCKEQFDSGLLHFVTRIRDRRYVAVDPERGLVLSYVFFDHSAGDTRNFEKPDGAKVSAGPQQPWTWQISEVFRLEKGKIYQIQATMERSPYGMNSGWSPWEDGMSQRARDVAK
ncbi:MAG: hypothetical protein ABI811_01280 [Acidobacteriota bacterium]